MLGYVHISRLDPHRLCNTDCGAAATFKICSCTLHGLRRGDKPLCRKREWISTTVQSACSNACSQSCSEKCPPFQVYFTNKGSNSSSSEIQSKIVYGCTLEPHPGMNSEIPAILLFQACGFAVQTLHHSSKVLPMGNRWSAQLLCHKTIHRGASSKP